MTGFSRSHNSDSKSVLSSDKRTVSGTSSMSKLSSTSSHIPQKIKSLFRITSSSDKTHGNKGGASSDGVLSPPAKSEEKKHTRQSRFLGGLTRNRSMTMGSESNALNDAMSPTAQANPYFAHQGLPALRHHNDGSVPNSPPGTPPTSKVNGASGANDQVLASKKEELARKLRRVASAPNAQGLFSSKSDKKADKSIAGASTANGSLDSESAIADGGDTLSALGSDHLLPVPDANGNLPTPGQIRQNGAFRRTYSSNSIKVRNVEVGPSSFDKIKLIGKGDVGKVYLVREKKSSRLYAMKGESGTEVVWAILTRIQFSAKRR